VEVRFRERRGRFVSRFQQPSFEFRRNCERSDLLGPYGAQNLIDQITCIITGARAHLLPQEVLNVSGQGNGHRCNVPKRTGHVNRSSVSPNPRLTRISHGTFFARLIQLGHFSLEKFARLGLQFVEAEFALFEFGQEGFLEL
jgi:hypothetical protein